MDRLVDDVRANPVSSWSAVDPVRTVIAGVHVVISGSCIKNVLNPASDDAVVAGSTVSEQLPPATNYDVVAWSPPNAATEGRNDDVMAIPRVDPPTAAEGEENIIPAEC